MSDSLNITDTVSEDHPEWCPHFGDGTQKALCPQCNGREDRERKQRDAVAYQFPAMHSGTPVSCGCTPLIGDMLNRLADDRIVCMDCVPK